MFSSIVYVLKLVLSLSIRRRDERKPCVIKEKEDRADKGDQTRENGGRDEYLMNIERQEREGFFFFFCQMISSNLLGETKNNKIVSFNLVGIKFCSTHLLPNTI